MTEKEIQDCMRGFEQRLRNKQPAASGFTWLQDHCDEANKRLGLATDEDPIVFRSVQMENPIAGVCHHCGKLVEAEKGMATTGNLLNEATKDLAFIWCHPCFENHANGGLEGDELPEVLE